MKSVLHVFSDSPYTARYIKFINTHFDESEHVFLVLVMGGESKFSSVYSSYSNCIVTSNKNIYIPNRELFKKARQILIHQMNKPMMMLSLLLFNRELFKKIVWVLWGGDVYVNHYETSTLKARLIKIVRRISVSKIKLIVSYLKEDYLYLTDRGIVKAEYMKADYPAFVDIEVLKSLECKTIDSEVTKVIVGNSADPSNNHIDILRMLGRYKDENVEILVILSYGGTAEYKYSVKREGLSIFGNKFKAIERYMGFSEYLEFINESDICVFNHERQQGLGNLRMFFALQKKVYIRNSTTPFAYFKRLGLNVNATDVLGEQNFNVFKGFEVSAMTHNRNVILHEICELEIAKCWQKIFDRENV